ncbi:hypothetical protein Ahy_B02g057554 isoform B [Arachis hypogaea]|uniref:Cyclic nucleotide-binding domain-containing protein n=1 Tax=Arachis hypogaea TaxID=3818 RepID=A0A445AC80_ARAHY|nr:hypothetical protein Ahy_B02g057554 isoform B [Arachis hypogaea]
MLQLCNSSRSIIMAAKEQKFERLEDLRSDSSVSIEKNDSASHEFNKRLVTKRKVLNPHEPLLQKWNKIFVITCVMAIFVDPLFFYISVINDKGKCLKLDETLKITTCVLRTFFDLLYVLRIIFQFRTGFIAPSSRVFGRGELIDDSIAIMKRYLTSNFIIDILSIIPLPQMIILPIIPVPKRTLPYLAQNMLKYTIIVQYVPRLLRLYLLLKEITNAFGTLTETAWVGAAYNLLLCMLASHVVGAFWYLFSVESEVRCWHTKLKHTKFSAESYLSCGQHYKQDVLSLLNSSNTCPYIDIDPQNSKDPTVFDFGIFTPALKSHVVESTTGFTQKFFFCFWWGLRNLSSLGQNLLGSTYIWENIFAIFIAIFGLVLFSSLIGNMQKYLQSTSISVEEMRFEEMKIKRREVEHWMSYRMIPSSLKERIRRYDKYKWQQNRGVEEEALTGSFPKDLRRDIKRHICLRLIRRVPMLEAMNNQLLDAMCIRMKPFLYTEDSYIVCEGDPVEEILFIMDGSLASVTTNGGRSSFFNCFLKAGDFCGEELLAWALDPNSSNLPISTRTVQTLTGVEAFVLMADDLKLVAIQFYSHQWRTWAACFIQVAWRQYQKKKIKKAIHEAERGIQAFTSKDGLDDERSTSSNDSTDVGFHNRKHKSRVSLSSDGPIKKVVTRIKVLDPQGSLLQKWNKIFVITSVMAISVDPLSFTSQGKCLNLDKKLKITACVLRTFFDLFYVLHIIFQFRTGFIAPSSRVFVRGMLVDDTGAIIKRYLSSHFFIDILSIIPLPQMVILAIVPIPRCSVPYMVKNLLKYTVISQYVPRLLRLYQLFKEETKTWGALTETAWFGAAYNLLLYIVASHVIGASWYLLSVESKVRCWQGQLKHTNFSTESYLSCGQYYKQDVLSLLNSSISCPYIDTENNIDPTVFDFGIFTPALQSRVIESTTDFTQKFFFCFWWGLRNLIALGQTLLCSTYIWENIFAIIIAIFGLVLFCSLIANVQVPMLENVDKRLLDGMCDRLKPVLYTEKSNIVYKGDLIDEMIFIMSGKLASTTANDGRSSSVKSLLSAGDFCGEELLTWALSPNSLDLPLPISTRTVDTISEVEAFALLADDLKFFSQQWRTWAACMIQAAWRRYLQKKAERASCEAQELDAFANQDGHASSPSSATSVYVSRFEDQRLESTAITEKSGCISEKFLKTKVVILAVIPIPNCSVPYVAKNLLKYTIIAQYVPRLLRSYQLFKEVTGTSGILTQTWTGAVYNLFLYMLASHVVGSFWYLFSVESELRCWHTQLKHTKFSTESYLSCGQYYKHDVLLLLNSTTSCTYSNPNNIDPTIFNFGIFAPALQSRVVDSTTNFPQKFFFCFWWGLCNLSSLGQNLLSSTYIWENVFAIYIAIFGSVLFASLIGNMEKYLQSTTVRVEEMRFEQMKMKRRDIEWWMSYRMLPHCLKERIRRYEQFKWQEYRGVDEEALILNLPKDLRRDIKYHLCSDLIRRVPTFKSIIDRQVLHALCYKLKAVLYTKNSCIVCEGDPVDEILFIMHGNLTSGTTNSGRPGFFYSSLLRAGDLCGEELLTWALNPNSSSNLPISTRTIETISEVEAFAIKAEDLKFYSLQWRTWAACFIQAAWRRYQKKRAKKNNSAIDGFQERQVQSGTSPASDGPTKSFASRIKVLDPQGPLFRKWNKICVVTCVMAIFVDPLFFYVPVINEELKCLSLNRNLKITACVLRTFFDLFYILRMIFQFGIKFIPPSTNVFRTGMLIGNISAIVRRYLGSHFIIDILSIIPLPQMVTLAIIPIPNCSVPYMAKNLLKYTIIGIGAFWYLLSVESEVRCWQTHLKHNKYSTASYLSCGQHYKQDVLSLLNTSTCAHVDPDNSTDSTVFNFGIFTTALQSRVVESVTEFPQKFFFCFWWGFCNLSSLGQNLQCSTYIWENIFAIFIAVLGLILFSSLIGIMQKYLQSTSLRVEEIRFDEMKFKRRDIERWMSHRMLPDTLKERIRRYEQYKWQQNRGVEEEGIIGSLPKDLRMDIKRHLCSDLLRRVPILEIMDRHLLDAMCARLKPVLYTENSRIVCKGDLIDEMLFIIRGQLACATTNVFFKAGDFCGEELITWAFYPNSSNQLPISRRSIETITEVEAFVLMADDLKFFSPQWRTWAACFIQAAWRQHRKKEGKESIHEAQELHAIASEQWCSSSVSFASKVPVSKLSCKALQPTRSCKRKRMP